MGGTQKQGSSNTGKAYLGAVLEEYKGYQKTVFARKRVLQEMKSHKDLSDKKAEGKFQLAMLISKLRDFSINNNWGNKKNKPGPGDIDKALRGSSSKSEFETFENAFRNIKKKQQLMEEKAIQIRAKIHQNVYFDTTTKGALNGGVYACKPQPNSSIGKTSFVYDLSKLSYERQVQELAKITSLLSESLHGRRLLADLLHGERAPFDVTQFFDPPSKSEYKNSTFRTQMLLKISDRSKNVTLEQAKKTFLGLKTAGPYDDSKQYTDKKAITLPDSQPIINLPYVARPPKQKKLFDKNGVINKNTHTGRYLAILAKNLMPGIRQLHIQEEREAAAKALGTVIDGFVDEKKIKNEPNITVKKPITKLKSGKYDALKTTASVLNIMVLLESELTPEDRLKLDVGKAQWKIHRACIGTLAAAFGLAMELLSKPKSQWKGGIKIGGASAGLIASAGGIVETKKELFEQAFKNASDDIKMQSSLLLTKAETKFLRFAQLVGPIADFISAMFSMESAIKQASKGNYWKFTMHACAAVSSLIFMTIFFVNPPIAFPIVAIFLLIVSFTISFFTESKNPIIKWLEYTYFGKSYPSFPQKKRERVSSEYYNYKDYENGTPVSNFWEQVSGFYDLLYPLGDDDKRTAKLNKKGDQAKVYIKKESPHKKSRFSKKKHSFSNVIVAKIKMPVIAGLTKETPVQNGSRIMMSPMRFDETNWTVKAQNNLFHSFKFPNISISGMSFNYHQVKLPDLDDEIEALIKPGNYNASNKLGEVAKDKPVQSFDLRLEVPPKKSARLFNVKSYGSGFTYQHHLKVKHALPKFRERVEAPVNMKKMTDEDLWYAYRSCPKSIIKMENQI